MRNREKVDVVVSERKLQANRRNAKLSTGPRDTGNSKYNALKHGLLSKAALIRRGEAKEDPLELNALLDALRKDFDPVGTMEEILVDRIAACYWRLRRAQRAEVGEIRGASDSVADETLRRAAERMQDAQDRWPQIKGMLKDVREQLVRRGFVREDEFAELASVHGLNPGLMSAWLFRLATLPGDAREASGDDQGVSEELAAWASVKDVILQRIDNELSSVEAADDALTDWHEPEKETAVLSCQLPDTAVLEKIIRYETAIERQMYRALIELKRLQASRLGLGGVKRRLMIGMEEEALSEPKAGDGTVNYGAHK